jgi:hypothetical protein
MRFAAHQPNYIPWCGYFAKIRYADIFVIVDDADISPGKSYVYRSMIRNHQGTKWLSIPTHRHMYQMINEVGFADPRWNYKHLSELQTSYGKTPFFVEVMKLIEPIYREPPMKLAEFNSCIIQTIVTYLDISTRIEWSSTLKPDGTKDDRIISLARLAGADTYISGKGGQNYQNPDKIASAGIRLEVHEYRPIQYPQIHGEFVPGLSILDALFHLGKETVGLLEYPEIQT